MKIKSFRDFCQVATNLKTGGSVQFAMLLLDAVKKATENDTLQISKQLLLSVFTTVNVTDVEA